MMKLRHNVEPSQDIPRGYGVAWRMYDCDRSACFLVPLNYVMKFLHDLYREVTVPKELRDEVWGMGIESKFFLRGVEAGRQLERRGR